MTTNDKMDTKELGLVLGKILLDIEDLHYGLWEPDLQVNLSNLPLAQQRYSDLLLRQLPPPEGIRLIDIGCGTGHLLRQLVDLNYQADGIIPAPKLAQAVRNRFSEKDAFRPEVYECTLEDFPTESHQEKYDVAIFSESFQYIDYKNSFPILRKILKPGGIVVICDFFKSEHHGDGGPGDRSFGGGHRVAEFYDFFQKQNVSVLHEEDITSKVSPNMRLANEILMGKVKPSVEQIGRYLMENYPRITGLLFKLFQKKLAKIRHKYFSGFRSQETFERYKVYKLIVFRFN